MPDRRRRQRRQRRRPIPLPAIAGAAAVVTLAVAAYAVYVERADRPTAERPLPRVQRAGAPIARGATVDHDRVPLSYRIVYDVELWRGGSRTESTEELVVRRPFDGWRERRRGGEVEDRTRTAFGRLAVGPPDEQTEVATAPGAPAGDLRLDTVLDDALEAGLVEPREVREVQGRRCRVYRMGGPIGSGAITPFEKGAEDWADLCFDRDGLLLEEVWVVGDRLLQRRLASVVEVGGAVDDEIFSFTRAPLDPKVGGGSLRQVDQSSRPTTEFWQLAQPPDGFEPAQRYALVPPVDESAAADPNSRIGSVVDVYVRGADYIAIDQGGTINQRQALHAPGPDSQTEEIDGLGTAELLLSMRTNEVRVLLDRGRFVRVYGTRPLAELVEITRALQLVEPEGTGLVYVDR